MLKLDDFSLVNVVAEQGTFTQAAAKLGVPQPNISRRIRHIENTLQMRLFDRAAGRRVILTDFGQAFVEHSRRVLTEVNETLALAETHRNCASGELHIGAIEPIANVLSREFFPAFLKAHPQLSLRLEVVAMDKFRQLFDGDLLLHHQDPHDVSLIAKPVKTSLRRFYASPELFTGKAIPQSPRQLRELPYLQVNDGEREAHQVCIKDCQGTQLLDIQPYVSLGSVSQAIDMAVAGCGFVWLPYELCDPLVQSGKLKRLFDGRFGSEYQLKVIYPSRNLQPPKVKLLMEALGQFFDKIPAPI